VAGAVSRIQDGKRVRVKVSSRTKYEIKGRFKVLHEEIDKRRQAVSLLQDG
jgi:hypothetical protein